MSRTPGPGRRAGEILLVVAGLMALGWASVQPRLAAGTWATEVAAARSAVDTVRTALRRYRAELGEFPPGTAGDLSDSPLAAYLPDDLDLMTPRYRVTVDRWAEPSRSTPSSTVAPPDTAAGAGPSVRYRAGITLASSDQALLASLLDAYGRDASFVRDSAWTLVVEEPPTP